MQKNNTENLDNNSDKKVELKNTNETIEKVLPLFKNILYIASALSLVGGAVTSWVYLATNDLLYIFASDISVASVLILFFYGYFINFIILFLGLIIFPILLILVNQNFDSIKERKESEISEKGSFNDWHLVLIVQFFIFFSVIFINDYLSNLNWEIPSKCHILFSLGIIYILLYYSKLKKCNLTNRLNNFFKPVFCKGKSIKNKVKASFIEQHYSILMMSLITIMHIAVLLIFIPHINGLSGSVNSTLDSIFQWATLIIMSLVYILFVGFAVDRGFNKSSLLLLGISCFLLIVLMNVFNLKGMLSASAEKIGIRDKENTYLYRFKSKDLDSHNLKYFHGKCHFPKDTSNYVYLDAFAKFRYKDVLILCTNEKNCVDISGVKNQRILRDQVEMQKINAQTNMKSGEFRKVDIFSDSAQTVSDCTHNPKRVRPQSLNNLKASP